MDYLAYHMDENEPIAAPMIFHDFATKQYLESEAMRSGHKSLIRFIQVLEAQIIPHDRREVYFTDGESVIGMLVTISYPEVHYGLVTAEAAMWVDPAYRNHRELNRLIISNLRQAAIEDGSNVYLRTSRTTEYVSKVVARRV